MRHIKNSHLAKQAISAVLLFGIAFVAGGAEQTLQRRALPAPAPTPAANSVPAPAGLPDLVFSYVTVEQATYDGQSAPPPIVVHNFVAPPPSNKKKSDGLPSNDLGGAPYLGCLGSFTFPLQLIVKNIGHADFVPKGSFQVVGVNVGSWGGAKDIVRLSPGQSQVMKFNVSLLPGKYTLKAVIDLHNEVAESRTDNNKLSWPLEVTCEVNRNEVRKLNH